MTAHPAIVLAAAALASAAASAIAAAPAAPPPSGPSLPSSPALEAAFAIGCGVLGLVFGLIGQRVWRGFLALSALTIVGAAVFYFLDVDAPQLPIYADALIAASCGLVAGIAAACLSFFGLVFFAAVAGGLVAFAVIRLTWISKALHDAAPALPLIVLLAAAAAAAAATIFCRYYCCCGGAAATAASDGDDDGDRTDGGAADAEGSDGSRRRRRRRRRRRKGREARSKVCEAFVTSVVGAYGIVYCVDHWVEGHVSPSDVLAITDLDNETFACAPACEGLLATFAGLILLFIGIQLACIRGQQRARRLEREGDMREPLAAGAGAPTSEDRRGSGGMQVRAASPTARQGGGRDTRLAASIRAKYFGPRRPQHEEALNTFMADTSNERRRSSQQWGETR